MFGSSKFKMINGKWEHIGYMDTSLVVLPAAADNGGVLPKGTWLQAQNGDDTKAQLASGFALGVTTQDISEEGQASVQAFKDRTIGKFDLPIAIGQNVSVRMPTHGSQFEVEGSGTAKPGNLVCTSGTGSISTGTARKTKLSVLNGCIRVAQTGDVAQFLLLEAALTPENAGYVRIRCERIDLGIV